MSQLQRTAASEATVPSVSVVVATHERPGRLEGLLKGLRSQTLKEPFEVIVVDDGSGPETEAVLEREAMRDVLFLRTLRNDEPLGPASARDAGWRIANAPVIAFTDDDCVPNPTWLESALRAIRANPGDFIQGRTEPIAEELGTEGPFTRTIRVPKLDPGFQTCNIVFPRQLLERIDGFDVAEFGREPGGEDSDLGWRAIEAGGRAVFSAETLTCHAINHLGPMGKLRVAARWTTPMRSYVRHEGLREAHFVKRYFWKGSHYLLVRALLGTLVPKRHLLFRAWLTVPYFEDVGLRMEKERASLALLPYYIVHDLVECWAVARAAVRYRHPMI